MSVRFPSAQRSGAFTPVVAFADPCLSRTHLTSTAIGRFRRFLKPFRSQRLSLRSYRSRSAISVRNAKAGPSATNSLIQYKMSLKGK